MSSSYLRIKPGEKVTETLIRFCADEDMLAPQYVHLTGLLELCKLTPAPGAEPIDLTTKAYLVNGTALIKDDRAKLMGLISWQTEDGVQMGAGRLSSAVSGGLHAFKVTQESVGRTTQPFDVNTLDAPELQTLPIEDIPLTGSETNLASTTEMPQLENLLTDTQVGWAEARSATNDQSSDDPVELQRGDVLMHPRFGPCRVVRVPSFGKVKVRRENGAFLDLHMKILHLTKATDPRYERVFNVAIGKPTS